jgi:pyruvate,orthophosphate dikinase
VPDDIGEISISDGILTGKGGATSHAAIVAHRLGKTCVVGFSKMKVWVKDKKCRIITPDQTEHVLQTGDPIGIDGRSGAIYLGHHDIVEVDLLS